MDFKLFFPEAFDFLIFLVLNAAVVLKLVAFLNELQILPSEFLHNFVESMRFFFELELIGNIFFLEIGMQLLG